VGVWRIFGMAARRWYLLVPFMLLSFGVSWLAYTHMPVVYRASVVHQVVPHQINASYSADARSAGSGGRLPQNPFPSAKAVAADLVASVRPQWPSDRSQRTPGEAVKIRQRPNTPLITVEARAADQAGANESAKAASSRLAERLTALQDERQVPASGRMTLDTPVPLSVLIPVRTTGVKVFAVTLVFGLMLSIILAAATERSDRRRRALAQAGGSGDGQLSGQPELPSVSPSVEEPDTPSPPPSPPAVASSMPVAATALTRSTGSMRTRPTHPAHPGSPMRSVGSAGPPAQEGRRSPRERPPEERSPWERPPPQRPRPTPPPPSGSVRQPAPKPPAAVERPPGQEPSGTGPTRAMPQNPPPLSSPLPVSPPVYPPGSLSRTSDSLPPRPSPRPQPLVAPEPSLSSHSLPIPLLLPPSVESMPEQQEPDRAPGPLGSATAPRGRAPLGMPPPGAPGSRPTTVTSSASSAPPDDSPIKSPLDDTAPQPTVQPHSADRVEELDPVTFDAADLWAPVVEPIAGSDRWLPVYLSVNDAPNLSVNDAPQPAAYNKADYHVDHRRVEPELDGWPDFDEPDVSDRAHDGSAAAKQSIPANGSGGSRSSEREDPWVFG